MELGPNNACNTGILAQIMYCAGRGKDTIELMKKAMRRVLIILMRYIVRVLEQTHWKVSGKNGAAEILGLDRSTLRARMRKLGIRQP